MRDGVPRRPPPGHGHVVAPVGAELERAFRLEEAILALQGEAAPELRRQCPGY